MRSTIPYFLTRDGLGVIGGHGVKFEVDRYTWSAVGGPDECWMVAQGPEPALLELGDLLRCPVEVQRVDGEPAWWGCVDGVWVVRGKLQVGVTLDGMGNRVRASYLPLLAGFDTQLPRAHTAWLDDADSQAMYGVKEYQARLSGAYADHAGKLAATALRERKYPNPGLSVLDTDPAAAAGGSVTNGLAYARIRARGWWHTAGWRLYEQPMGLEQCDYPATGLGIMGTPASHRIYQHFTTAAGLGSWLAHSIYLRLHKYGAPADNVVVILHTAGGAVLATSNAVAGGSIPAGNGWVEFVFPSPATIAPATEYYFYVARTGGNDTGNYYYVSTNNQLTWPLAFCFDGGAWPSLDPPTNLIFKLVGREDTAAQLGRMLAAGCGGQFFTGLDLPDSSGVSGLLYRPGEITAREEAEELLLAGSSSGTRYLASVDNSRRVTVYSKPGVGSDWGIRTDGRVLDPLGGVIPAGMVPCGVWVHCADMAPVAVNGQQIADPTRVFVERAEWDEHRGRVKFNQGE